MDGTMTRNVGISASPNSQGLGRPYGHAANRNAIGGHPAVTRLIVNRAASARITNAETESNG